MNNDDVTMLHPDRPAVRYRLVILAGPHAGAELLLAPGRYTLGRSDQCDIILNDDSVAPQHVRLTLDDNGLRVGALAQPTSAAGAPLDGADTPVANLTLLDAGSTRFCVGLPHDDWSPVLDSPTCRPACVTDRRHGSAAAAGTSSVKPAGSPPNGGRATGNAAAVSLRRAAAQLSQLSPRQIAARPRRAYSLGAAFLLICGALLVVTVANTKSVGDPTASRAPLARVHRILDDLAMTGLDVSANEFGMVKIEGFVESAREVDRLNSSLQPLGNRILQRVWSDEGVVADVAETLRADFGVTTVHVADASAGHVRMAGYYADATAWERIANTLRDDVKGVVTIDDDGVEHFSDRLETLRQMLSERELGRKLQLVTKDQTIHVSGALSPEDLANWRSVERDFKKSYGGQPSVRAAINQAPDLELAIRGVSIGLAPFITTQDGSKYMEGSTLANGYVVRSIKPDRLILSKQDHTTVYYLGGE